MTVVATAGALPVPRGNEAFEERRIDSDSTRYDNFFTFTGFLAQVSRESPMIATRDRERIRIVAEVARVSEY